ncbi:hypothetical protein DL240_12225 [Lujinxingia litoralis]|uniref:Outer membrane protein beta-barrel domain-containing protein n=1 Tax=Lujinxingia litoralis TaxID=2211119 RepID=A0A328C5Y6_9DELT|nr:hypothetical protein [Lujinxingia litoralis]RAL21617.1 hypothetical protein DL240_12225 [Lujinxingia litoralis]
MNLSRPMQILGLLLALLLFVGCETPSDPVAQGTLCTPPTGDCPSAVSLQRIGVGRNALEFEVRAPADEDLELTLEVSTPEDSGLPLPEDLPRREGRVVLAERSYMLGAGERLVERIEPFELTVTPTLLITAEANASAQINYLLVAEPLECIDDGDCPRRETCEPTYGRCANCLSDGDCQASQTCDRRSGRCFPETQSGCQLAPSPGHAPPLWPLGLLLLGAVLRARRASPARAASLSAVILFASTFLATSTAHAAPGASLSVGAGGRLMVGSFAEGARPGWGLALNQEFRWRHAGMSLQLISGNHTTHNDSPPFEAPAHSYGVSAGPRAYLPLGPIEAQAGVDYMWVGLAGTGLVQNTGLDRTFHALGGTAGARFSLGSFHLIGRATYHHLFDAPGGLIGLDVMVGMGF